MRIVSGVKPSGKMHIGNYLGAVQRFKDFDEAYIFVADYHVLNYQMEPEKLENFTFELVADYMALGMEENNNITLFLQSQIPEVTELTFILSNYTPMGLLERAHAYKDSLEKDKNINHGLFTYPVLMAADILLYKAEGVPVGQDQKQHLEMTRDIAQKFNNLFGDILTVPKALIEKNRAVIPGIDGRKMSKSYSNTIPISLKPKQLKNKIMSIKTDSTPIEEPMDYENCNVFNLYRYFATDNEIKEMKKKYKSDKFGYGHAKLELFKKMNEYLKPIREKREDLLANKELILKKLEKNAEKARRIARKTISEVRKSVGLIQF